MNISIVMYHYVRDLKHSRFPKIRGLSTEDFREQVTYIKRFYNVISGDDLLDAASSDSLEELPPRALLLTFDDGYIDHFTQVFPILHREKIKGSFFPPVQSVFENRVLNVNKIHFVLAAIRDVQPVVDHIFHRLDELGREYHSESKDYYWSKFAVGSRFDSREVTFIKRMLQRELPETLSQVIINELFKKYVCSDEASFARELYMTLDQLVLMRECGMHIGSHGNNHYWLNNLDAHRQREEVSVSLDLLSRVGARTDNWMMCYPYGAYDNSLLEILKDTSCAIGLTTRVGIANLDRDNFLTLPRLDTNDLPKNAASKPNAWTLQTIAT